LQERTWELIAHAGMHMSNLHKNHKS